MRVLFSKGVAVGSINLTLVVEETNRYHEETVSHSITLPSTKTFDAGKASHDITFIRDDVAKLKGDVNSWQERVPRKNKC